MIETRPTQRRLVPPLDNLIAYCDWQPAGTPKGTVIGVGGLTRQKHDLDFIAAFLSAEGYRFLAVDPPGHGESARLREASLYNNPFYAEVFAAFCREMNLSSIHWIGMSMGGLIPLEMALKGYGGLFRSLTFVDITPRPYAAGCARLADYMATDRLPWKDLDEAVDHFKKIWLLGDEPETVLRHCTEHQMVRTEAGYIPGYDPRIAPEAIKALSSPTDLTEGMKRLTCPVALVAGALSGLCRKEEIADLQQVRPDLQLHLCPGVSHMPVLSDAPTQEFILDFLEAAGTQS